jgi:hypothetical protein
MISAEGRLIGNRDGCGLPAFKRRSPRASKFADHRSPTCRIRPKQQAFKRKTPPGANPAASLDQVGDKRTRLSPKVIPFAI